MQQGQPVLDFRGSRMREEIREILRQHGIDAKPGTQIDTSQVPGLQEEIMEVLARHGVASGGPEAAGMLFGGTSALDDEDEPGTGTSFTDAQSGSDASDHDPGR